MTATSRWVRGDHGVRLHVRESGEGCPVLLVHGGLGSAASWDRVAEQLPPGYRLVALDRRGHGRSGDRDEYTLDDEYADVSAVASALAEDAGGPVDAVGHSIGAVCVLGAAARGAPLRRLVLAEPPGPQTVSPQWLAFLDERLRSGDTERVVVSFLVDVVGVPLEQVRALAGSEQAATSTRHAWTLGRGAVALAALDLPALARTVHQPTLLLLGGESPAWAAEITHSLAHHLPSARLALLPGQGHEVVHTAPRLVADLVHQHLSGVMTPGPGAVPA